ncbi:MAG: T9SS type A sorting domain-containing protein [Crocinitomix sp.]|nr:T9SS type A sorting domain-containing protein [Crocinitomix sp.]
MKAVFLILLVQLFSFTSFSQGFEFYRIYDLVTFSGDDISGTVFDTTASADGSEVTVRFGMINRTGELQRWRIQRRRLMHAEGTLDKIFYSGSGGSISFSYGDVSPEDLFTPDVDLFSKFVNDGDSIKMACIFTMGEIKECSYYRYYIIDDFDVRLDSVDVNFCEFGLSINEPSALAITAYPNPTAAIIHLNYPAEFNLNARVQITDLAGEIVLSTPLMQELNLSTFASGLYILTILDNESLVPLFTEKIAIE